MPLAVSIEVADAVVTELGKGLAGFTEEFMPERKLIDNFDIKDSKTLKVIVVPVSRTTELATRSSDKNDIIVLVGIRKKIVSDVESETETLCGLVDEISAYLRKRPLSGASNFIWIKTENEPLYDRESLYEERMFRSVLAVTYRAML